jgi:hypothetical protein
MMANNEKILADLQAIQTYMQSAVVQHGMEMQSAAKNIAAGHDASTLAPGLRASWLGLEAAFQKLQLELAVKPDVKEN